MDRLMGLLASMKVRRRLDILLGRLTRLWTKVLMKKLLGRQMGLLANMLVVMGRIFVILGKLLSEPGLLADSLIVLRKLGVLLAFLTGLLARSRRIRGRPRNALASRIGE